MAVLAGIDEAGYGPHLGPLVVAAAAFEFPGAALPDPDLWGALRGHICKRPADAGERLVICDSKVAYRGGRLATLERAVLGFLAAMGLRPRTFAELLDAVALPCAAADGDGAPAAVAAGPAPDPQAWHRPEAVALPVAASAADIDSAAAHLEKGLAALGGRPCGLWVNTASAARLNRLIAGDRNKAGALFTLAADLLAEIFRRCPHAPVHVTMDRHGGRRYYAKLLSGAFPMMPVETLGEGADGSRYGLHRTGGPGTGNSVADAVTDAPVLLTVRDRCESWSLPTALASMAAKYLRELDMRQLNAYFQARVPGLRPTAGYGLDAWRFLEDVAAARTAAGVSEEVLLRQR
jgi:hypothetical protein